MDHAVLHVRYCMCSTVCVHVVHGTRITNSTSHLRCVLPCAGQQVRDPLHHNDPLVFAVRGLCNTGLCWRWWWWRVQVAEIGRDYFFMNELEEASPEGGKLVVHIADAFDAKSAEPEGFSCLIVDLFADGKVLPQLTSPDVWAAFRERLAPAGRVVANLGGPSLEPALAETDEAWQTTIAAARAVAQTFPGEAYYRRSDENSQESNYLVMTGPPYEKHEWASLLPDFMGDALHMWKPLTMDAECFKR